MRRDRVTSGAVKDIGPKKGKKKWLMIVSLAIVSCFILTFIGYHIYKTMQAQQRNEWHVVDQTNNLPVTLASYDQEGNLVTTIQVNNIIAEYNYWECKITIAGEATSVAEGVRKQGILEGWYSDFSVILYQGDGTTVMGYQGNSSDDFTLTRIGAFRESFEVSRFSIMISKVKAFEEGIAQVELVDFYAK